MNALEGCNKNHLLGLVSCLFLKICFAPGGGDTLSYEQNLGQVLWALQGAILAAVAALSPVLLSPALFFLSLCQGPHKPFVPCLDCAQMCRASSLPELPGSGLENQISFKHRCFRNLEEVEEGKEESWVWRKHRRIFPVLKPVTRSNGSLQEVKVGRIFHVGEGKEGHEWRLGAVVVVFVLPPRPRRPASPRTNSSPWFSFSNDNAALSKDPTLPKLIFWQFSKCKLLFKQTKTPKHFVLIFANNNSGEGGKEKGRMEESRD